MFEDFTCHICGAYASFLCGMCDKKMCMPVHRHRRKVDSEYGYYCTVCKNRIDLDRTITPTEDDKCTPTSTTDRNWLYVYNCVKNDGTRVIGYGVETRGKWLVFSDEAHINASWSTIKDAVQHGLLGEQAKVGTKVQHDTYGKADYAICVYTEDVRNEKDVMRVRQALRDLGFTQRLHYKTDADTLAGKYKSSYTPTYSV